MSDQVPCIGPTNVDTFLVGLTVMSGSFAAPNPGRIKLIGSAKFSPLLSPVLVNANAAAEQIFTVPGLAAYLAVNPGIAQTSLTVNKLTAQAGLGIGGVRWIGPGNPGQIGINFFNVTGVGITPTAAEQYEVEIRIYA